MTPVELIEQYIAQRFQRTEEGQKLVVSLGYNFTVEQMNEMTAAFAVRPRESIRRRVSMGLGFINGATIAPCIMFKPL
jgi:hypothetical protein